MKFFRRNKDELSREELIRRIQQAPMPPIAPPQPRIDMSFLTSGPYPPIRYTPSRMSPLLRMMLENAEETPQGDCVREVWEDREASPGYAHNAFVSDTLADGSTNGIVVSVTDSDLAPAGKPINLCVVQNTTGSVRVVSTYQSIAHAQQIVNQLMHAISLAEARTKTEA